LSYPWAFEHYVNIDPDDILDYVKDNKDWFFEKLQISEHKDLLKELIQRIHDLCNNDWDFLRQIRDGTCNLKNEEIIEKCKQTYNQLEDFVKSLENQLKEY
jgi:hypothetical protein